LSNYAAPKAQHRFRFNLYRAAAKRQHRFYFLV
jgi:hypothetical protein